MDLFTTPREIKTTLVDPTSWGDEEALGVGVKFRSKAIPEFYSDPNHSG